jgi:predicted cupin superfamily sugar epimerase
MYQEWFDMLNNNPHPEAEMFSSIPEPTNPLGADSIRTYRAAIRWLYEDHQMAKLTGLQWTEIWSPSLDFLLKQAQGGTGKEETQSRRED